jgi:dimethylargininase
LKPFDFNRALVRLPSSSAVNGLRGGAGPNPSLEGIRREHAAYVGALEAAGLVVTTLPPLEEFPDALFVEDPALVLTNGAVLLRPGAPSRRGESSALEPHLCARFAPLLRMTEGQVDGGDVLVTPRMTFIGLSARTNPAGAAALVDLMARLGCQGKVVQGPPEVLHLKSACSLLDAETLLATPALVASGIFKGFRVLTAPQGEEDAANLLRLNESVLVSNGFPRTLDLLDQQGFNVLPLQTTEVSKLDAGLSCMSLRWHTAWPSAAESTQPQQA